MESTNPLNICKEESDSDLATKIQKSLGNDTAAIALLMTYNPKKVSPTRTSEAYIGLPEELGIEQAILSIKKDKDIKNLFLLINSFGGMVSSSYKIAAAIRENFEKITVFVPHIAASGGTLIALTGNKIVMGDMSNLTPIDVQTMRNGQSVSVNSMIRAFNAFNELFSETQEIDAPYPWKAMADKFDPVEFQEWYDTSKLMEKHALEILKHRNSSFKKRAESIVKKLTEDFPTHQTSIRYSEAREIFGPEYCIKNDCPEHKELVETMQLWFENYLPKESANHIIRYAMPQKKQNKEGGLENAKTNVAGRSVKKVRRS
jgi:ATP-dependent protease ClpP protease subunit